MKTKKRKSLKTVVNTISKAENCVIVENKFSFSAYKDGSWAGSIDKNLNDLQGIFVKYDIQYTDEKGFFPGHC